jgi:hypothetical protein
MTTYADKYAHIPATSIEHVEELSQAARDRRKELKAAIKENRTLLVTTNYDDLIRIGSYIHAAAVMKRALEDPKDNITQNNHLIWSTQIANGMLEENGLTFEQYQRGEF